MFYDNIDAAGTVLMMTLWHLAVRLLTASPQGATRYNTVWVHSEEMF